LDALPSFNNEILQTEPKTVPDYILKDPYILEFLDLGENKKYHENELERERMIIESKMK